MSSFIPDGYCGLYCAACPQYLISKAGKAEEMKMEECHGCKSEVVAASWCRICTLKKCARSKGIEFCYECDSYPCKDLENFRNAPEWPYHIEVYDYMKTIKNEGKEKWLAKMAERWSCSSCGKEASWWDLNCTSCGAQLNGYKKP